MVFIQVNSQFPEYFVSPATFSSAFLEHVAQCHYSSDLTQLAQNLVDLYISQLLLEELMPDVFLETFAEFIKVHDVHASCSFLVVSNSDEFLGGAFAVQKPVTRHQILG